MGRRSWILAGLVIAYMCYQKACWDQVAESKSPNGENRFRVEFCGTGADGTLRAVFKGGLFPVRAVLKADALPGRVYAGWSEDSKRVGLLVQNPIGRGLRAGFDYRTGTEVPFEEVRPLVVKEILRTQNPSAAELALFGGDVIEWAERRGR
jgi:hypothetical protein